jgi:hypothetical protein
MKRIAAILVFLLLAGFAVYEFAIVKVCDGSFNVTVEIDAKLAKDVTHVSYMPVRQTQMDNTPDDVYVKQVKFMEQLDEHGDTRSNSPMSLLCCSMARRKKSATYDLDWSDFVVI